jgi:hypothetical protein
MANHRLPETGGKRRTIGEIGFHYWNYLEKLRFARFPTIGFSLDIAVSSDEM